VAAAAVPDSLVASTIKAACWFAAGQALPAGAVSAQAVSLAKGALRAMTGTKLAFVMLVILAVGGTGVGLALVAPGVGGQARANRQLPEKGEGRLPSNEAALQVVPQGKLGADRPAREGIQVTLASVRQEYRPGEAVDLILTIKNNGKAEFSYLRDKIRELNDFEITGPDGKEVKRVWNPVEFGGQATFVTVKPGEAVTLKDELKHINLSINLSKVLGVAHFLRHMYYPMDSPGTYRLRIKVGDVTSNVLAIKVLPAEGFGDEVKELRARVSLAEQKFPVGEPIEVKYVVKNVSKEEQTLWHSGFWPNHLVIVRNADGKEPALTEFGQQRRKAFSPGGERFKNVPVKVPAGGEDTASEQYDLTKLYDLATPGRYTVQYVYEEKQGGWEGRLPSNEATFEVLPPVKNGERLGTEESKLQGLWLATELDGAGANVARDGKEWRLLVEGDKIVLEGKGEKREYRFKLRSVPPNNGIDLFPVRGDGPGQPLLGIYYMVEDRLTLCFYKDAANGRPPEFSAKIDIGLWALECRHVLESRAVRVDGLEFVALSPVGVAPAPVGGIRTQVELGLRVTNVSDKPVALGTFDVIRPRLHTADGKELRMDGGRDGLPKDTPPALLAAGASWTWKAQAKLQWMNDRSSLRLYGSDRRGLAEFWSFSPLKPGMYQLAIEYTNRNPKQDDTALWVGTATTKEVEFEIEPREKQQEGAARAADAKDAQSPPVPPRQVDARSNATDAHGDPLPSGALARSGTVRFRHGGAVLSLAYLGKGKILASGGYVGRNTGDDTAQGNIRLWQADTGKELRQFQLQGVAAVAASPDGKILAGAGSFDGTVFLWDVATGQEIRRLTAGPVNHSGGKAIIFSPDSKTLAVSGPDPSVRLWDVGTGNFLRTQRTVGPVDQVAFSPDGKILAFSCSDPNALRLFEVDGWKELSLGKHDRRSFAFCFAFSPDCKTLAASMGLFGRVDDQDRPWIKQYELATGGEIRQFQGHRGRIHCVAFSPDGKTLASAAADKTIRLWEVATGKERQALSGDQYSAGTLAFAPDGKTLASANFDGLIRIWDLATSKVLGPRAGHQGVVSSVALSADGKTLFSAGSDGTIRTWETSTGKELRRLEGHQGPVVSVILSPDGKLLASGSSDGTVRLWETATGKELRLFPGSNLYVSPLSFSPDGKTLATSVFPGGKLCLWEVATGKDRRLGSYSGVCSLAFSPKNVEQHKHSLTRSYSGVCSLAFSPDGKTVAAGGLSYPSFGLWDTTTLKHRQLPIDKETHEGPVEPVTCAAFSPDGKTLFTGSWSDRNIRLWEVATGKELRRFLGDEAEITCLALSPDGRTLASAGYDRTVRLWEVTTGKERRRFVGHRGRVTSLAWSADGKTLASGSGDGTALVWDVSQ
jgi:uncharacterized protein (TIGR03067 family)